MLHCRLFESQRLQEWSSCTVISAYSEDCTFLWKYSYLLHSPGLRIFLTLRMWFQTFSKVDVAFEKFWNHCNRVYYLQKESNLFHFKHFFGSLASASLKMNTDTEISADWDRSCVLSYFAKRYNFLFTMTQEILISKWNLTLWRVFSLPSFPHSSHMH